MGYEMPFYVLNVNIFSGGNRSQAVKPETQHTRMDRDPTNSSTTDLNHPQVCTPPYYIQGFLFVVVCFVLEISPIV